MAMKVSLAGAMEIIGHEAIVLSRYRDSKGIWTIGVGHTASAGKPNPATFKGSLSAKEAFDLFRRDLARFEGRVNRAFKVPLRQHEFDAAVSFDFNTGAIHEATWVRLFNAGKRDEAIAAIMNWKKPIEIIPRRRKEQSLFRTGFYTGAGFATVYPATPDGRVLWGQGKRVDLAREFGRIPGEVLPPSKPAGAQKPAPAPAQPGKPQLAPAKPAGGKGGIWGAILAFLAAAAAVAFAVLKDKDVF